jgi:hypothetical protein
MFIWRTILPFLSALRLIYFLWPKVLHNLNMKIAINDKRKIAGVQEEFNNAFPFLRLEFYAKPHTKNGAPAEEFVENNRTLNECRNNPEEGEITVSEYMTASELKERFMDVYGLGIEVLRKTGDAWLLINSAAKQSLAEENRDGEKSSKHN